MSDDTLLHFIDLRLSHVLHLRIAEEAAGLCQVVQCLLVGADFFDQVLQFAPCLTQALKLLGIAGVGGVL